MEEQQDFSKRIPSADDGYPMLPTVEFTEDEWVTVYNGHCVSSSFYSYKVDGNGYGTFWIPKCFVRLASLKPITTRQ